MKHFLVAGIVGAGIVLSPFMASGQEPEEHAVQQVASVHQGGPAPTGHHHNQGHGHGSIGDEHPAPELDTSSLGAALVLFLGGSLVMASKRKG